MHAFLFVCYEWTNTHISCNLHVSTWCDPSTSFFSLQGLCLRDAFTTVPCANTPSLPRVKCVSLGADTGWEKRSNKRKDYIHGGSLFPTWTTTEHRASTPPPALTIQAENSMWTLGWGGRKGHAGVEKATSRNYQTELRWSSLVALPPPPKKKKRKSDALKQNKKKKKERKGAGTFIPNRGENGLWF